MLHLHEGQIKAWRSKRRTVMILAGYQSGKTSFGPVWLYREMGLRGFGDYMAVAPTYSLMQKKLMPELTRFLKAMGGWEYKAEPRKWVYGDPDNGNGSQIFMCSADNPESLESATAKGAWLDEAGQSQFRLSAWEAINRRLGLHQGRILITTTPYNLGWLKQQVYDPWKHGAQDIAVIQFESTMNPIFPHEEAERAKRDLAPWKYAMFFQGRFERPAGLIYDCFIDGYKGEEGGHKVRPFDIPPHWARYVGMDFGGVNTAKLYLAKDPATSCYYIYHETLSGSRTIHEHAADVIGCDRDGCGIHAANPVTGAMVGLNLQACYGGSRSEGQWRTDFANEGLYVQAPPKPPEGEGQRKESTVVEVGIAHVYALIKNFRLYIFDTCVGTIEEILGYARKLDDNQQPTEEIENKEAYHRLDALRYIGQAIDQADPYDSGSDPEPQHHPYSPGRLLARSELRGVTSPVPVNGKRDDIAVLVDVPTAPPDEGTALLHKRCGNTTRAGERELARKARGDIPATYFCGMCQEPFPAVDFSWV